MGNGAVDIVKSFAAKWEAKDAEGVIGHLSDDCVCNNTPLREIRGKPAIRSYLVDVFDAVETTRCNWKSIVPDGDDQVLCEVEKVMTADGEEVSLETMVAFTVRDGQIQRWNSYFDRSKLQSLNQLSQVLEAHS